MGTDGYFLGYAALSAARVVITMGSMWSVKHALFYLGQANLHAQYRVFFKRIVVTTSLTLHERLLTAVMR